MKEAKEEVEGLRLQLNASEVAASFVFPTAVIVATRLLYVLFTAREMWSTGRVEPYVAPFAFMMYAQALVGTVAAEGVASAQVVASAQELSAAQGLSAAQELSAAVVTARATRSTTRRHTDRLSVRAKVQR